MSSIRARLLPIIAAIVVAATGIGVLVLLQGARRDGVAALEDAKAQQVTAIAKSFDARLASAFQGLTGLSTGWDLGVGNEADQDRLQSFSLDPDALSGFFLIDTEATITAGTLLTNAEVGDTYDHPDYESLRTALDTSATAITQVGAGKTSDLPVYAFLVGIRDLTSPTLDYLGALVFEVAVDASSSFNLEIAELAVDGSAGDWYFLDTAGTVIASTEASTLGMAAPLPTTDLPDGLSRLDGDVIASAPVPSVGWRVVFREDAKEFDEALAGPLQTARNAIAAILTIVGLLLVIVLNRRLVAAREEQRRLQALASSQEEFISIVSHELRTPVAGVLGFLQTSLDHWDEMADEERLHTVRRAVSNARRLQTLTRDVLDVESVEAGRLSFDFQPVDLAEEVRLAIEAAQDIDRDRTISLTVERSEIPLDADPDRLSQVLNNLLENARSHSPASTPIEVCVGADGDSAVLTVTDQGAGIDPDDIDAIFDKFVRGRGETVSGTGLGLYISKRIVDEHRGSISASSDEGSTVFEVRLPLDAGSRAGSALEGQ